MGSNFVICTREPRIQLAAHVAPARRRASGELQNGSVSPFTVPVWTFDSCGGSCNQSADRDNPRDGRHRNCRAANSTRGFTEVSRDESGLQP